jgi:hypothetical protein
MSIKNRLLTVSLGISQWTGSKKDKRETAELAAKHGLPSEAGRVYKSLLPMAEPLEVVHKMTGKVRTFYYERSVPWVYGNNVIKAEDYMTFAGEIRPMLNEWDRLADKFAAEYPRLKAMAPHILKGMYDEKDYPPVEKIRSLFKAEIRFAPVPDAEHIVLDASDAATREAEADLRQAIESEMQVNLAKGMERVWSRVYDVVKHAHEKLSDPSAMFRDSLVSNAQDLVKILPSLNIANDPNLTALGNQLSQTLARQLPDALREPGQVRASTAAAMKDIMNKMGAFYSA